MAERSDTPDTNTPPQPLLEDEQLDRLDDFLDSDQVDEDALDLISAHGFLVALAVAPSEVPPAQWLAELFQGEPRYADDAERDEIMLPFMLLSGLFDDEPDMAELAKDQARQESLVVQLPELVLDLYLHYRVPPETSKPKPRKKTPAKGKKR